MRSFACLFILLLVVNCCFSQNKTITFLDLQIVVTPCGKEVISKAISDSVKHKNEEINKKYSPTGPLKFQYTKLSAEIEEWTEEIFKPNRHLYKITILLPDNLECSICACPRAPDQEKEKTRNLAPYVVGFRSADNNTFESLDQLGIYFNKPRYFFNDSVILNMHLLAKPTDTIQINNSEIAVNLLKSKYGYVVTYSMLQSFPLGEFELKDLNNKKIKTRGQLFFISHDTKMRLLDFAVKIEKNKNLTADTKTLMFAGQAAVLLNAGDGIDINDMRKWLKYNKIVFEQ